MHRAAVDDGEDWRAGSLFAFSTTFIAGQIHETPNVLSDCHHQHGRSSRHLVDQDIEPKMDVDN